MRELQNGTKDESISKFANTVSTTFDAAVAEGVDGSVNSFVLSPQLELMGHLPYQDLTKPNENVEVINEAYLTFSKGCFDEKQIGAVLKTEN